MGHGSFSHATEDIMRACLKEDYSPEFDDVKKLLDSHDPSYLPVHESYSYMLTKNKIKILWNHLVLLVLAVGRADRHCNTIQKP